MLPISEASHSGSFCSCSCRNGWVIPFT